METVPILLDTDIGSDIDDAVALAYLLKQARCRLLGITTVSGEPGKRAMLADAVCNAGGRDDIPIHVGTAMPLLVPPRQPLAPQAEALTTQWPHRAFGPRPTAIDFLRSTIRAHPGEITLLAIGPLTNIALLFATDPEIPALIKQIVLMGGRYFTHEGEHNGAEWNILCDPHAAAMVFAAPVPRLSAIGLDVTLQCALPADECRRRFAAAGGSLSLVAAMAEVWFRGTPQITFHDPLAAAMIFVPTLCGTQSGQVSVELCDPRAEAHTTLGQEQDRARHAVASDVNPEAFFEHYFATVGG